MKSENLSEEKFTDNLLMIMPVEYVTKCTFTEEILNGKLHFLRSVKIGIIVIIYYQHNQHKDEQTVKLERYFLLFLLVPSCI